MLELCEFKQLVDENEIDYNLTAQNYRKGESFHSKHILWMRLNFNKSIFALKGEAWT